jgi:hypothetical protein
MRRYTSGLEKHESAGYLLEANTPDSRMRAVRAGFVRIGEHLRRSAAAYGVLLPHILAYPPDSTVAGRIPYAKDNHDPCWHFALGHLPAGPG